MLIASTGTHLKTAWAFDPGLRKLGLTHRSIQVNVGTSAQTLEVASRAPLSQVRESMYRASYRQAETRVRHRDEATLQLCATYEKQIRDLQETTTQLSRALEKAQQKVDEASQVTEQHRRMSANLSLALTTEANRRQALEKDRTRLKQALKETTEKIEALEDRNHTLMTKLAESETRLVAVIQCASVLRACNDSLEGYSTPDKHLTRSQIRGQRTMSQRFKSACTPTKTNRRSRIDQEHLLVKPL